MELLESAALTPLSSSSSSPDAKALKLPDRVQYLREAIQCASLAQVGDWGVVCVGGGGWGVCLCLCLCLCVCVCEREREREGRESV
jgi:hypothetical protein